MPVQEKATLYRLIDDLPDSEIHAARRFLEYLRTRNEGIPKFLRDAPEDDAEPDEIEALGEIEADDASAAGRVHRLEDVKRQLGL